MECVYCATGHLRASRLTLTFTYGGRMYPLADPAALVGDHCGETYVSQRSQRAAAALRTVRMVERTRAATPCRYTKTTARRESTTQRDTTASGAPR
jgi:hypothetical protein